MLYGQRTHKYIKQHTTKASSAMDNSPKMVAAQFVSSESKYSQMPISFPANKFDWPDFEPIFEAKAANLKISDLIKGTYKLPTRFPMIHNENYEYETNAYGLYKLNFCDNAHIGPDLEDSDVLPFLILMAPETDPVLFHDRLTFIIDSGCSRLCTKYRSLVRDIEQHDTHATTADGSTVIITERGQLFDIEAWCYIYDDLPGTLMPTTVLTHMGYAVLFNKHGIAIEKNGTRQQLTINYHGQQLVVIRDFMGMTFKPLTPNQLSYCEEYWLTHFHKAFFASHHSIGFDDDNAVVDAE